MIELGLIAGIALLVVLAKLPWRSKFWVISHPVLIDAAVFTVLTAIHWGTFSGVMVATIAAFFCSCVLGFMKWLLGHVKGGRYFPGKFNMIHKLV